MNQAHKRQNGHPHRSEIAVWGVGRQIATGGFARLTTRIQTRHVRRQGQVMASGSRVTGVAEIVLSVVDLPRMREFYKEVLGFELLSQACHTSERAGSPTPVGPTPRASGARIFHVSRARQMERVSPADFPGPRTLSPAV